MNIYQASPICDKRSDLIKLIWIYPFAPKELSFILSLWNSASLSSDSGLLLGQYIGFWLPHFLVWACLLIWPSSFFPCVWLSNHRVFRDCRCCNEALSRCCFLASSRGCLQSLRGCCLGNFGSCNWRNLTLNFCVYINFELNGWVQRVILMPWAFVAQMHCF